MAATFGEPLRLVAACLSVSPSYVAGDLRLLGLMAAVVVLSDLLVLQEVLDSSKTAEPAEPARLETALLELDGEVSPTVDGDQAGL